MVMPRSNNEAESRLGFPKVTILLFLTLVAFSAATNAANDRVGVAEVAIDTLAIYPDVSYQQLELTVAGNGQRFEQSFGPGEVAVFSLLDYPLPDGQYRYELIASPSLDGITPETARSHYPLESELALLERANTFRQVGTMEVVNGEIFLLNDPGGVPSSRMPDVARKGGGQ